MNVVQKARIHLATIENFLRARQATTEDLHYSAALESAWISISPQTSYISPTNDVLGNVNRFAQTLWTPRHRWEWIRLLIGAWIRNTLSGNTQQCHCSVCERRVPGPCICPVCLEKFCSSCYRRSWIRCLFGDRGCPRCSIVVQRYEYFHGVTSHRLETGVYCVVHVRGPPEIVVNQFPIDDLNAVDEISTTCFSIVPKVRHRLPAGLDIASNRILLTLTDEIRHTALAKRVIAWLFLNIDKAQLEFKSLDTKNNVPTAHETLQLCKVIKIEGE